MKKFSIAICLIFIISIIIGFFYLIIKIRNKITYNREIKIANAIYKDRIKQKEFNKQKEIELEKWSKQKEIERPHLYSKKENFLSKTEMKYLRIIQLNFPQYNVIPQINLASIVKKNYDNKYINELFRNIDIGIFDNNYNPLLLIEINDKTHTSKDRKERDKKVEQILKEANIKLLTFWYYENNSKEYIIKKIEEKLNIR